MQRYLLPSALLLLTINSVSAAAVPSKKVNSEVEISSGLKATPVKRVPPRYPKMAARWSQEGWVQVSYVVDTDGSVIHPVVIKSFGNKEFERAALKALKKWKFSPSIENGKPVQQCDNKVQLDFKLQGNNGANRHFVVHSKAFQQALQEKHFNKAKEWLELLEKKDTRNFYEIAWLNYYQYQYYMLTGNKEKALDHLIETNGPLVSKDVFNDKLSADLLSTQVIMQIQLNRFAGALDSYARLQKLDTDEAKQKSQNLAATIDNLHQAIDGNHLITVDAKLNDHDVWNYKLVRHQFSLADIDGDIHKLSIRCDRHFSEFKVKPGLQWNVPANWGACNVLVSGAQGASFKLVELPGSAAENAGA